MDNDFQTFPYRYFFECNDILGCDTNADSGFNTHFKQYL